MGRCERVEKSTRAAARTELCRPGTWFERDEMTVTVWVTDGQPVTVEVGAKLCFGRDPGPAQLAVDDPTVSRRHGFVHAFEGAWAVSSTGSRLGLLLFDRDSPSRLNVPVGAGPVTVPFEHCAVVIESRHTRHALIVHGPGAAGWKTVRASVASDTPEDAAGRTLAPWAGLHWRDGRSRQPLRWYRTLVAMCEPYLAAPPVEVVPSDAALAQRLGTTTNVVQSRLISEVRDALGFDRFTPQLRQTMVAVALSQGLVTRADLDVLDSE